MAPALRVESLHKAMPRQPPEVWLREDALGDDFFAYMGIRETYPDPAAEVVRHDAIWFDAAAGIALDAGGEAVRANLPLVPDTPLLLERIEAMRRRIDAGDVVEPAEAGPFALLATPRHDNYFHCLCDDLGRLGFYEALEPPPPFRYAIPAPRPWQRQLYALAGIESRVLALPAGVVALRDVWVAPRGLAKIEEFRGRAFARVLAMADRVPDAAAPGPRRLYVSRQGTRHRRLRNERDVRDMVEARGFAVVRPETMAVADQIRLFRGAEVALGVFGAGLANAAFMRPGGTLLEIAPSRRATPPVVHNAIFSALAGAVGLRYGLLSAPSASVDDATHDFDVPLDWLEQLLDGVTNDGGSAEKSPPLPARRERGVGG